MKKQRSKGDSNRMSKDPFGGSSSADVSPRSSAPSTVQIDSGPASSRGRGEGPTSGPESEDVQRVLDEMRRGPGSKLAPLKSVIDDQDVDGKERLQTKLEQLEKEIQTLTSSSGSAARLTTEQQKASEMTKLDVTEASSSARTSKGLGGLANGGPSRASKGPGGARAFGSLKSVDTTFSEAALPPESDTGLGKSTSSKGQPSSGKSMKGPGSKGPGAMSSSSNVSSSDAEFAGRIKKGRGNVDSFTSELRSGNTKAVRDSSAFESAMEFQSADETAPAAKAEEEEGAWRGSERDRDSAGSILREPRTFAEQPENPSTETALKDGIEDGVQRVPSAVAFAVNDSKSTRSARNRTPQEEKEHEKNIKLLRDTYYTRAVDRAEASLLYLTDDKDRMVEVQNDYLAAEEEDDAQQDEPREQEREMDLCKSSILSRLQEIQNRLETVTEQVRQDAGEAYFMQRLLADRMDEKQRFQNFLEEAVLPKIIRIAQEAEEGANAVKAPHYMGKTHHQQHEQGASHVRTESEERHRKPLRTTKKTEALRLKHEREKRAEQERSVSPLSNGGRRAGSADGRDRSRSASPVRKQTVCKQTAAVSAYKEAVMRDRERRRLESEEKFKQLPKQAQLEKLAQQEERQLRRGRERSVERSARPPDTIAIGADGYNRNQALEELERARSREQQPSPFSRRVERMIRGQQQEHVNRMMKPSGYVRFDVMNQEFLREGQAAFEPELVRYGYSVEEALASPDGDAKKESSGREDADAALSESGTPVSEPLSRSRSREGGEKSGSEVEIEGGGNKKPRSFLRSSSPPGMKNFIGVNKERILAQQAKLKTKPPVQTVQVPMNSSGAGASAASGSLTRPPDGSRKRGFNSAIGRRLEHHSVHVDHVAEKTETSAERHAVHALRGPHTHHYAFHKNKESGKASEPADPDRVRDGTDAL
ncbi:unnamed protein product [Amoebophrya sp. A25]|nr:unnamed protein product [Amoebophrya sp. A25]|eukprot:GSA25T00005956001.1